MRRSTSSHLQPAISRRAVALGLLATPATALARSPDCGPAPQILFVCEAGTVNSAIARESFRARAADAGLDVRVTSRGLHPEDHLTPAVATRLRADGIDPALEPAKALAEADVTEANIVVAFNAAADDPLLRGARRWNVPSWGTDYATAKAAMDTQIGKLVAELGAGAKAGCAAPPK
jgi:hypothetical protein